MQKPTNLQIAIGTLWLFHVSGIIGISLGYSDWFVTRTSMNLYVLIIVLMLFFPLDNTKKIATFLSVGTLGFFVEYLGVNFGYFFGEYSYGENLGPKFFGVPWLIGANWAMLVFITGCIANKIIKNLWIRALIGAFLMLFLDFFMEKIAPIFDFWEFTGGVAPLDNYVAWGAFAFLFHLIFQWQKMKGSFLLSLHMYIVQLVFFIFFYVYF
jgi:putative membrane protein